LTNTVTVLDIILKIICLLKKLNLKNTINTKKHQKRLSSTHVLSSTRQQLGKTKMGKRRNDGATGETNYIRQFFIWRRCQRGSQISYVRELWQQEPETAHKVKKLTFEAFRG